jgi:hypothetical protein
MARTHPVANVWLDTEFNGFGGELVSMALVDEFDSHAYFSLGCSAPAPWVAENVMPILAIEPVSRQQAQAAVRQFLHQFKRVNIVADWPEDIKHFCAFMVDGPAGCLATPPLTFELRLDISGASDKSAIPHNALEDARSLRRLYCEMSAKSAIPAEPSPSF